MGWTWDEYWDQPEELTQALMARWEVESEHEKAEMEKAKKS